MKYLKYLRYLLAHKWYVMIECFCLRVYWRGLMHDMSKFLPSEFFPYADKFFGVRTPEVKEKFKDAWLLHQKRNRHHWQWWVLMSDNGETDVREMPDWYRREMLADWRGAGKAQGNGNDTRQWYMKNKNIIQLHWRTRVWVEEQIGLLGSP